MTDTGPDTDRLFAQTLDPVPRFRFSAEVSAVFEDMVRRSVPGYGEVLEGIGRIARTLLPQGAVVYDIGCSTGAASLAVLSAADDRVARLTAVDLAPDMVTRARQQLGALRWTADVDVQEGDAATVTLQPADLIIMNLTLQFIDPADRQAVISRYFSALKPGGLLILTEKLAGVSADVTALHEQFKADQGYSQLEIAQKRRALEDVMRLDSRDAHLQRLTDAGFAQAEIWYQNLSFASFLAVKGRVSDDADRPVSAGPQT